MEIPLNLRLSLKAGSVYYFVDREITSPEPHYFVVLNKNPIRNEILILAIVTSNIDRIRRLRLTAPQTIVEFGRSEYRPLTLASIVDGNDLLEKDLSDFAERWERREIKECLRVSDVLLARLLSAVLASELVTEEVKALLR
jgi:hypothetical protein